MRKTTPRKFSPIKLSQVNNDVIMLACKQADCLGKRWKKSRGEGGKGWKPVSFPSPHDFSPFSQTESLFTGHHNGWRWLNRSIFYLIFIYQTWYPISLAQNDCKSNIPAERSLQLNKNFHQYSSKPQITPRPRQQFATASNIRWSFLRICRRLLSICVRLSAKPCRVLPV